MMIFPFHASDEKKYWAKILDIKYSPCKVTIENGDDAMNPLRGFVVTLSASLPVASVRDEFRILAKIVNANTQNPTEVVDAVELVKKAMPASMGLLACFRMIPQGKRIMQLVEEFVAGRATSMKLISDLNDIKNKATTLAEVVPSLKVSEGVTQCLSLLSDIRHLTTKKLEDQSSKIALNQAKEELTKLADTLVNIHVVHEVSPWIQTQSETLRASRVMCRSPAFEITKLKPELESTLGYESARFKDLASFFKSWDAVSAEVDAMLHIPRGDTEEAVEKVREVLIRLCQGMELSEDSKKAVFVSCPGLFIPCKAFGENLGHYANEQCVSAWKQTMVKPLQMVTVLTAKGSTYTKLENYDPNDLAKLSTRVADAKLLATGFQQEDHKQEVQLATNFVESVIKFASVVCQDDKVADVKLVAAMHAILVSLNLAKPNLQLKTEVDSVFQESFVKTQVGA